MSEVSEVGQVGVQVVRVAFDGAELAFKLGTQITRESIEMLKKMLKLLAFLHTKSLLNNKKRHAILGAGKTSMKYMEPGANFLNIKVDEKDRKLAEKLMKQYGVLFTKLPDLNREDGMCEYLYNAKDVSKVNMVIDRLNSFEKKKKQSIHNEATNQSMEQYLNNVSMEELEKALQQDDPIAYEMMQKKFGEDLKQANEKLEDVEEKKVNNEKKLVNEEEKHKDRLVNKTEHLENENKAIFKEEMSRKIRFDEMDRKPERFVKISLNESLAIDENTHSIKFTMPKSEKDKFIWISKNDLLLGDKGKTFYGYLDKDKEYIICSIKNQSEEKLKGKEVFERYLDPVEQYNVNDKERTINSKQEKNKQDSKKQEKLTNVIKDSNTVESKATEKARNHVPKKSR